MTGSAGDFVLTMVMRLIVAGFLSIVGGIGIAMLVMILWGAVEGLIAGVIVMAMIVIIVLIITHDAQGQ